MSDTVKVDEQTRRAAIGRVEGAGVTTRDEARREVAVALMAAGFDADPGTWVRTVRGLAAEALGWEVQA